jgi:hypothetical protein
VAFWKTSLILPSSVAQSTSLFRIMQRESIHRYRILRHLVTLTASAKVLGEASNWIDLSLSSSVAAVVDTGIREPQQWLKAAYLALSPFVTYRRASASESPTSITRVGNGVDAGGLHMGCFSRQLVSHSLARATHSSLEQSSETVRPGPIRG